jgi:WD40 repeat protein
MGRPDTELYRGVRLRTALEWCEGTRPALTPIERDFLDDAQRNADAGAKRERGRRRRRRGATTALALLMAFATLAGFLAIRQADRADEASATAAGNRAIALARDADAVDEALLLAVEAVRLEDSDESREALLAALSRSPLLIDSYQHDSGTPARPSTPVVAVSPDGEVVIAGDGASAAAHDADTLDVVHRFDHPVQTVVYRPDGKQLAISTHVYGSEGPWNTSFDTVPVRLLRGATFEPEPVQLGGFPAGAGEAWDIDYSADGRRVAADLCVMHDWWSWDFSCTAAVWDVATPEHPVRRIPVRRAWGVALSRDGSLLYVGSYEPALEVYDVASGVLLRSTALTVDLAAGNQAMASSGDLLQVSPDGNVVAVRDFGDVVLLDARTLTERSRLTGHSALVQDVEFSHDGTRLASGGEDGAIIEWDVATGLPVEQLRGHTEAVRGLEFGLHDDTLYSAAADRRLLAWDLRGDRRFIARVAAAGAVGESGSPAVRTAFGVPAPDGEAVAYMPIGGAAGDTLRFLDVATGRMGEPIVTRGGLSAPAWRPPEFEEFARADGRGFVRVWDWRRGTLIAERQISATGIVTLSYTPDGSDLVALDDTPSILQVDADTLEPTGQPIRLANRSAPAGDQATVSAATDFMAVGPDGRTAVAVLASGTSAWVDLAEGRIRHRGDLGLEPARAAFSPDGRRLAVAANSGEVGLFQLDTWTWVRLPVGAHSGWALGVTWAPDGRVFASYGQDGRVSLWDGGTGEQLATVLPGNPGSWAIATFLPDGHTLIIATTDHQVFTWDTRLESWVERACEIAGRNLTSDEWRDAFGDRRYRQTCATT